jgi:glutathione S-transferase
MHDTAYELVIGNKNWSSWSLRPWLLMKAFGIRFREVSIPLRRLETRSLILDYTPSGKVPILKSPAAVVWDSLAITEHLAENHRDLPIWPQDVAARGLARSVSAEIHSGFHALRRELPMEILAIKATPDITDAVKTDVSRIVEIWKSARAAFGGSGPYLFGAFSAADAMFAPVATRFQTYSVNLGDFGDDGGAAAYARNLLEHPAMHEWREGAKAEQGGHLPHGGSFG